MNDIRSLPPLKPSRRQRWFNAATVVLLLIFITLFGFAVWRNQTTPSSVAKVPTSTAVPQPKPARGIEHVSINTNDELVVIYTDKTTEVVGKVVGDKGKDGVGLAPSGSQIARAIDDYCAGGICDGQNPTQSQVLAAVTRYCTTNNCVGASGQNGANATDAMVAQAVASYCASGRCVGPKGDAGSPGATGTPGPTGQAGPKGDPGTNGRTPVISCVTRTVNATAVNYIAWKYTDEPDSAYRDLYKLPAWAPASNCVTA